MRKPLIAGNWKMNGTKNSVSQLLNVIKQNCAEIHDVELAVLPPFVFLEMTEKLLAGSVIRWGAQTVSEYDNGAYTGEISTAMLREFHCHYVLVGHSERRMYYGEANEVVAAKYVAAAKAGLTPIVCVGETLEQRNSGNTLAIIRQQLNAILGQDNIEYLRKTVIAYEPVWAIGTGLTAKPDTAQEIHDFIRQIVAEYDKEVALKLRILYGGSVKRDNAAALFNMPDIDGGLIGGASLNPQEFLDIANACNS